MDKRQKNNRGNTTARIYSVLRFAVRWEVKLHTCSATPGALASEVQIAYSVEILYPNIKDITTSNRKLSISQQAQIRQYLGKKSLRQLAKEHSVSHEAIRRTINKWSA